MSPDHGEEPGRGNGSLLRASGSFITLLGQPTEDWGEVTSVRVWYLGGPEVEYGIASPDWTAPPLDPGARSVLQAGRIVLYDPQDRFASLTGM